MSKHRFYIPAPEWNPENLRLTGDEAHHCRDVMRVKEGERVIVFNGEGSEIESEVAQIEKDEIQLIPRLAQTTSPPPAKLTLGQAIPKGKNMDLIVQKATELGASEIVPLISDRTVVRIDPAEAQKKQEKWQRVALEACKQCGQNWLPKVATPISVERFLTSHKQAGLKVVAALHADARPLHEILDDARPESASVLIGPEGDFTPAELSASFSAGYAPLSLGPIVLRSETAAIYALSVLGYELMR